MRAEYDFSQAKKNPHASKLRKPISIRLDTQAIEYFKGLGEETGMPYQSLINMYVMECVAAKKRPSFRKAS